MDGEAAALVKCILLAAGCVSFQGSQMEDSDGHPCCVKHWLLDVNFVHAGRSVCVCVCVSVCVLSLMEFV
jgi:hypothetical protein